MWPIALPIAAANISGAALGARLAIANGDGLVRGAVLAVVIAAIARIMHDLIVR